MKAKKNIGYLGNNPLKSWASLKPVDKFEQCNVHLSSLISPQRFTLLMGSYWPLVLRLKIELSIPVFLEECGAAKPLFSIKRVETPKKTFCLIQKKKKPTHKN